MASRSGYRALLKPAMPYVLIKPSYLQDRAQLPAAVQRKLMKCEALLCENPRHSGLQSKRLQRQSDLFEARVDQAHRLVYACHGDILQLLAVGPHDVIDRRIGIPPVPDRARELTGREHAQGGVIPAGREPAPPRAGPTGTPCAAQATARALPAELTENLLTGLGIPGEFHQSLLACPTEDDLLCCDVPEKLLQRVVDYLYPAPVQRVRDESNLVVQDVDDLQRHSDGQLVAFLLQLDPEQEIAVKRALNGPSMVRGGPGTGKSLVALYRIKALIERAIALRAAPPRILFTTYTSSLIEFSRQLLEGLLGKRVEHVTVSSIDRLAMEIVTRKGKQVVIATPAVQQAALQRGRQRLGKTCAEQLEEKLARAGLAAVRDDYLLEEIEWVIEGRGTDTLDEYLAVDRRGRGYGSDQTTRQLVWQVYEFYRAHLARHGAVGWKRLQREAVNMLRSDPTFNRWDYVLVDEAQDLAPVGLVLAFELCRRPAGMFFAADGCQSIYHKGFRFSDLHDDLELRGRSTVLKRNYRSTREIADGSVQLLAGTDAADKETLVTDAVRYGEEPAVVVSDTPESQIDALVREVRASMSRLKLPLGALAVLCPSNRIAEWCVRELAAHDMRAEHVKGRNLRLGSSRVKVMTIHTAKGLEFPMVAVIRVEEGELPRSLPRGAEDEQEHLNAQRRLLFVGCTRAMRKLWITTSGERHAASSKHFESEAGRGLGDEQRMKLSVAPFTRHDGEVHTAVGYFDFEPWIGEEQAT